MTSVGNTSNNANQRPDGLSNISGSNHCHRGRLFSFRTDGSAMSSVELGLGREEGVILVDTGGYRGEEGGVGN